MGTRFYGFARCFCNISRRPATLIRLALGRASFPRGKLLFRVGRESVYSDVVLPGRFPERHTGRSLRFRRTALFFNQGFLKSARFTVLPHTKGSTVKRAFINETCVNRSLSIVNCQPPTVNCQLSTVNCQLPKIFNFGSKAAEEISTAAEDLGEIAQAQAGAGATAQGEAAEVAGGLAVGGVAVLDGVQGL